MSYFDNEALFKKFYVASDWANTVGSAIIALAGFVFALSTLLFGSLILFDFGFRKTAADSLAVHQTYLLLAAALFASKLLIELLAFRAAKWFAVVFRVLVLAVVFVILLAHLHAFPEAWSVISGALGGRTALLLGSLALMATQMHHLSGTLNRINISPSFLFAGSFLAMILAGAGLLMLPNATLQPISAYEALFTATSAVCVTGMMIVDPSAVFSPMGKNIILGLIQTGGLGIMTFTGFFSYLFLGSASLKDRFLLKDFFSGDQLGGLYKLLLKILLLTILVEAAGSVLIYRTLEGDWMHKTHNAVFHAVSAFCNAGFSVNPQEFNALHLQSNFSLQFILCGLVVLGGIGFPLLLYFYKVLKFNVKSIFFRVVGRNLPHEVLLLAVGERLALHATLVLLVLGAFLYYALEAGSPLPEHFNWSQGMTALVSSVNARTSGFSMTDPGGWSYPTVFLTIFLMWVGASPGSTGGGIKTTTLAVAVKTVASFLRGKDRLEIGNREIGSSTIVRAFSVIVLSLMFIFAGFLLLMIFDPGRNPVHLLFECVAAFSTTGLSIAGTMTLSTPSQVVLMILMFVGRIGPVIVLSGFLATQTQNLYRLPVENIKMN
ncbi:MAG: potassium transporter TrkG [Smithellaceae bacterium]|jgi:Trk-type K+ transport system membrane component|nr:potassium transporter TrkG [Smithellaceae bacterium]MDD3260017.1 potassium transporter TrkG [Smithellaceae bacterium]MDD3848452.1 potassium transporter TrkG [Smithellaceae bacterium]HOG12791.1 potassium transporter TrkG [Smithellaceae bacterium]HOQ71251.1 potassium transporter TrkG [Smithellaceae bacterium]